MLLEIQDISKSYSKKGTVLDHISFQMREGIYGLLGPNGHTRLTLHQNHKKIISMLRSASI